jgi:hypothetical protein
MEDAYERRKNRESIEDVIDYTGAISDRLNRGDYATAISLIDHAEEGISKEPFYTMVALRLMLEYEKGKVSEPKESGRPKELLKEPYSPAVNSAYESVIKALAGKSGEYLAGLKFEPNSPVQPKDSGYSPK